MLETAGVFSEVLGRKVSYVQIPWDKALETQGKELTGMFRWLNDVGFNFNIDELRKIHAGLRRLKDESSRTGLEQISGEQRSKLRVEQKRRAIASP